MTLEKHWKYKGLDCVCVGQPIGHRCGYGKIPEGNRFYGLRYNDKVPDVKVNLNRPMGESFSVMISAFGGEETLKEAVCTLDGVIKIHGGVTFTEHTDFGGLEGFWIGFDCGHCDDGRDLSLIKDPRFIKLYTEFDAQLSFLNTRRKKHIWTTEDVVLECEKLADQILNEKGSYEE